MPRQAQHDIRILKENLNVIPKNFSPEILSIFKSAMKIKEYPKLGKICFYLNLIGTIYFVHLLLLSYLEIDTPFTGFIRELFTLPILGIGIVMIILSIVAFKADKYSLKTYSFGAIIVIVVNILMLTFATIFNI